MSSKFRRLLRVTAITLFAVLAAGAIPASKASAQMPWWYRYPTGPYYQSPVPLLPAPFGAAYTTNSVYAPPTTITVRLGSPSASYSQMGSYANTAAYGSAGYASGPVAVAQNPQLGAYLVAGGMTLYMLSNDRPGVSACYGTCVSVWPPLRVSAGGIQAAAGIPGVLGSIIRSDGIQQVTYNGLPLYYFSHDMVPGDTNGQGVTDQFGHWTVARP